MVSHNDIYNQKSENIDFKGLAEVINRLIFNNLHNPPPTKYFDTIINPLAAGGTHVSISTLPEGHICPKSIDLTTFSLANKIYHI
jgi:hypothetical protein